MTTISFKPKQITKNILATLPDRARDIITKRFGLGGEDHMTLDAIGREYGITRERVRQIEQAAFGTIRKSDVFTKEAPIFNELEEAVERLGGIVAEDELLSHFSKDKGARNHILFFLVLGDSFKRQKEDEHFNHRWSVDDDVAEQVHMALKKLYASLSDDELVSEQDMVERFLSNLKNIAEQYKNEEIVKRWLSLSKKIGKNPLGEYGVASSPNIRARGMRDYAFLAVRRSGGPLHFTEVAKEIENLFGKKAHTATCHNELIKDPRFVLVGRGLYALNDWGYASGVVRDVIKDILNKEGPLTKQEIIRRVLKERYVKNNTILVNLQNGKHFKKDKTGRYNIA